MARTDSAALRPDAENRSVVEGVLPVIPTPFLDGAFDKASMGRYLEHFLPWLDGYTLLGSTGEAPSLTTSQRMEIAEWALEATPSDRAVIVGVSHTSVEDSVRLARHAESIGATAVLCAVPYYFANSDEGILRFLRAVDDAVGIELVLYDNPAPTNTFLQAEAVIRWAKELTHLRAVKLTDHNLDKIAVWHEAGLNVVAGDDPIAFRYLAEGVDAAMIIAPSIFPEAFSSLWRLAKSGRLDEAYDIFASQVLPFSHLFGIGDEIATSKVALQMMGIFASAEVLAPLTEASPERRKQVGIGYRCAVRGSAMCDRLTAT